jgi:hypothetical protein
VVRLLLAIIKYMKVNIELRVVAQTGVAHYIITPEEGQIIPQWYLAHFTSCPEEVVDELPQPSVPPILCIPWLLRGSPLPWLDADLSRLARTES